MKKFNVKAKVIREVFHNGDFRILAILPLEKTDLELNRYGNCTITGELGYLDVDKEYTFVLCEGKASKYGMSYNVLDVPSMKLKDLKDMTYEEKYEILRDCTSSDRIATNILEAYPNYIELVVENGDEIIDTSKIVGVGRVYNKAYTRTLVSKFKYYTLCHNEKLKPYEITIKEAKDLYNVHMKTEDIIKAFKENPYYELIEICGRSLSRTDKMLRTIRPELIDSTQRTEALLMEILKRNEYDGNTRLNGSVLFSVVKNDDDYASFINLIPKLKDVAVESELIYFDDKSCDLSLMSTYIAECNINSFVREKIKESPIIDDSLIEKYRNLDGSELSDEQLNAVRNFNKYSFTLLTGSAGCVDKDTEFFNGYEWKKISDYQIDDMVLQYTEDGRAELVRPNAYIKLPCDTMYFFKTKYGANQMLSDDHNMVFDEMYETGHTTRKKHHRLVEMKTSDFVKSFDDDTFNAARLKFRTTFHYDGAGIDLTDNEIKTMCAVICDGSFYSFSREELPSWKTCRLHIKKERKKTALRELFISSHMNFREVKSKTEGYTDFYITAPRREKVFSSYWYNCSQHQLQIICDNILQWDGSVVDGKKTFSTTSKQTVDFIQFAFSSCGYRAVINPYDRTGKSRGGYIRKSIEYTITITERTLVGLRNKKNSRSGKTEIKKVATVDGFKYCFNVPSHMLVLRRNNKIFITGNCGKTFDTKAVINFCDDNHLSYTLLAPTGSASLRLKESTGRDAMTIHLKCLKDGAINTDVLLVDESSMVDLPTFNMMLNCIQNPDIRICLVGDKSQILPVGIGCVFADMINSKKVPLTELTKVFRYNDNGILYMATNTRQGRYCLEDKNVTHRNDDYTIGGTYHFSEVGGKDIDEKILERVTDRYFKLLKKGVRQKDILILSAYNVGDCGVDKINEVIQAEVNPPSTAKKEFLIGKKTIIRVGDRVINIKNDYKALTMECYEKLKSSNGMLSEEDLEDTTTIFNGQRGVAVDVLDDGKALVCSFDNEIIVFTKMKAKNIKLAYAISYHKSQGQESPYVISVVTPNQSRLLNRNLLYVGQTRGKKEQFDIGSTEAMKNALSIDGVERRDTWLYDLLSEEDN